MDNEQPDGMIFSPCNNVPFAGSLVAWLTDSYERLERLYPEAKLSDGYFDDEKGYDGRELGFVGVDPSNPANPGVFFRVYTRWGGDLHVGSNCQDNRIIRQFAAWLAGAEVACQCFYAD